MNNFNIVKKIIHYFHFLCENEHLISLSLHRFLLTNKDERGIKTSDERRNRNRLENAG